MIGRTLSHYKVLSEISRGGMGIVYRAVDLKLDREVALKVLLPELVADPERKRRFVQEAKAAAKLEHPHIGVVHEIDEAEGTTFIAMELIQGEKLKDIISRERLPLTRALELATEIAEGLARAHDKGIVHRDLKPANIMVTEDGHTKIIDFGLAKLVEPLAAEGSDLETLTRGEPDRRSRGVGGTDPGKVMGTVSYMSPEQARGQSVDARSDIFSFGVVLYEMLKGKSPFQKASIADSLSAVLNEDPPGLNASSAELAPELQRILRKALAKDLLNRYQNIKDLANDLKDARAELRPAVAVRAATRFPWPWVVVTAIVLVGIVMGWALLGGDRGPPGIGESGRPAIAVMYFENLSGDEEVHWLSRGLPTMLITTLAQTPGLDVISSERIEKILKQLGEDDVERIDRSLVDEVGRRAGAGAVVVGSIFKSGDDVRIDVQVQDIGSGRVVSAESVQGQDLFPMVDELTGRIRTGLELGDRPAGRPLADVTTPSIEALKLYSEGLEAVRNLRSADARRLLEEALEIDPGFALACLHLARIARWSGDNLLREEYAKKLLENSDRLPERQKLYLQAENAGFVRDELKEAEEIFERLISLYPDEEDAYLDLAILYNWRIGDLDNGFATLERGIRAVPRSGQLRNEHAYWLLRRGRYQEAVSQFETYAELNPGEANPQDSLAEAYLIIGQPEEALKRYARALDIDPSFGGSHGGRAWAYGMLGRYEEALVERAEHTNAVEPYHSPSALLFLDALTLSRVGRYLEAEEKLRQGIEIAVKEDDAFGEVVRGLLMAVLGFERGKYTEVTGRISRLKQRIPKIAVEAFRNNLELHADLLAGAAEVRRGNLAKARAYLDALSRILAPDRKGMFDWTHHALRAEIALAEGEWVEAESAFMRAEPLFKAYFGLGTVTWSVFSNHFPFRNTLARAKTAQGDLDAAISIYRELNAPGIGNKWVAMFEPRYVLETARLLDRIGDKVAARLEYQRFLDLWKDADPGLPELDEARQYLRNTTPEPGS